jgi:hypothetical protein
MKSQKAEVSRSDKCSAGFDPRILRTTRPQCRTLTTGFGPRFTSRMATRQPFAAVLPIHNKEVRGLPHKGSVVWPTKPTWFGPQVYGVWPVVHLSASWFDPHLGPVSTLNLLTIRAVTLVLKPLKNTTTRSGDVFYSNKEEGI